LDELVHRYGLPLGQSASWPCPAPSPRPQRGAPCRCTPKEYQTSVGTSQQH
jgi:hypothetical protein